MKQKAFYLGILIFVEAVNEEQRERHIYLIVLFEVYTGYRNSRFFHCVSFDVWNSKNFHHVLAF
jgi:hypothetical protein